MRKVFCIVMFIFLLAVSFPASAAIYDIPVTAAGDHVFCWEKGWSWTSTWDDPSANPNPVYHWYDYDNRAGAYRDTYLSFNLSPVVGKAAEIISATLNFKILEIWGSGAVGTLSGIGSVYGEGGTGWKFFDVTSSIQGILANAGTTADYAFLHTSQSGFTFGSAEGGEQAYLRITTAGGSPVPVPPAVWLLGSGLAGLLGFRRKIRK